MRTNVILVDFENVQPTDVGLLRDGPFRVKIFLGSNQAKVPVSLASALQSLGTNAEYVILESAGKNALDFHIAYYLGTLSAEDKSAYFHVISKDTGFDPLIKYLKGRKISVQRSVCIGDMPYFKTSAPVVPAASAADIPETSASIVSVSVPPKALAPAALKIPAILVPKAPKHEVPPIIAITPDLQIEMAIADLAKRKSSKPRTEKTLISTLHALFKKELSEKQLTKLVLALRTRGVVKGEGTKVTYDLPSEA